MDRHADEAEAEIAHGDDRPVHHGEQRRHRRVAMADGLDVGARPIDAEMDGGLGRRQAVAVEQLAVEIDHQHLVGGDAGAAGVARQDENAIGAGNAGADMAAVVEQVRHHHHAMAIRELLPQGGFRYLRHRASCRCMCLA
jgi:hypothetical protein